MLLHFGAVCDGGVGEKTILLAQLLETFSHILCYPQANWAILVLITRWVGLCMFQDLMGLSSKLSCELGLTLAATTPTDFYTQRF